MSYQFQDLDEWAIKSRTPDSIRDRIISMFRAPINIKYLRSLFNKHVTSKKLRDYIMANIERSVYSFKQIDDIIYSDSIAQRSSKELWGELRRINSAFFDYQMKFLDEMNEIGDESYSFNMFEEDSLRPPGLEGLNDRAPLHNILENQQQIPGMDDDDWGWDSGNKDRTPEEAMAQYWGENGEAYNNGQSTESRFMRYPTIPRWQHTSNALDGTDLEINENLGSATREMGSHVRRWGRT